MLTTQVNIYQVGVLFHGMEKTFTFVGDVGSNEHGVTIDIPPGIHAIIFTLATTHSATTATFVADPIEWIVQDPVLLNDSDDFRCSLVITNLTNSVRDFGFRLKVNHDGQTFESPDPTIINDPPVSPPGG